MIRTLVVDDEKLARDRLLSFLRTTGDIEVIGQAKNGAEAVKLIEEHAPDLVFLDVQMPGIDGFGVLRSVTKRPHVIFATAFDDYAIKAFEVEAVDYLLKPITRARLHEAVRRARSQLQRSSPGPELQGLLEKLEAQQKRFLQQVPVHRGKQILLLPTSEIYWFSVEFRLVYAHTDGDNFMSNFTLKDLEERLDHAVFFRAHKSKLVNLEKVKAISRWFGGRYKLVMQDAAASEVELSRTQARLLRARMGW